MHLNFRIASLIAFFESSLAAIEVRLRTIINFLWAAALFSWLAIGSHFDLSSSPLNCVIDQVVS